MESSSISSSDGRPWLATVLAALAIVVGVEVVLAVSAPAEISAIEKLNTPPGEDVFVVGNSMFQTGLNFGPLAEESGRSIAFDYHNGHYTNLWYLIADQVLPQADPVPETIVWGFRPRYAADPAFRQNRENDNDLFEPGDDLYRSLTIGSGDPVEPWQFGQQLGELVRSDLALWQRRDNSQSELAAGTIEVGVDLAGRLRPSETAEFRDRFAAGDVTVTDEILRIATGGDVVLAEERVVDGQGDFVRGPLVSFEDSFIPAIADRIAELDTEQLVVIWKPVTTVNDRDVGDDPEFVQDAIDYFEANEIRYLNLYDESRITLDMFASGDHYNEAGRALITSLLAAELAR